MDTRDKALTKLTQLHDKSHPTHHRPTSLQRNYSHKAVSIMKLVMDGDELDEIYHVIELVLLGLDP